MRLRQPAGTEKGALDKGDSEREGNKAGECLRVTYRETLSAGTLVYMPCNKHMCAPTAAVCYLPVSFCRLSSPAAWA